MKTLLSLSFLLLVTLLFAVDRASAQFPKIKIPKPKATPAAQPTPDSQASQPVVNGSATQPTERAGAAQTPAGVPEINWTRIQFRAETLTRYKGDYDVWSWVPHLTFTTTGQLPSGAHYYVEVAQPGGAPWMKFDCKWAEYRIGYECRSSSELEAQSITAIGVVPFTIKMRNELAGTEATLFTGRAKVEKVITNGAPQPKQFVYYVNQDWNLPIGIVSIDGNKMLNVRFWVRGEGIHLEPHVFYQGNEIGPVTYHGIRTGGPSCGNELDYGTSQSVAETLPQRAKWQRIQCSFGDVVTAPVEGYTGLHVIGEHNGDYEVKVLRNNRLARSIKFTVENGKIKDNGIYAANKMGGATDVLIVPVAILDDQDGPWDKALWKTDAFYGHPLTGFTWP
jgi:hypothetical protein